MFKIRFPIFFIFVTNVLFFSSCNSGADKRPVNIIFMIADGAGFNHFAAASLYEYGKTGVQVYEHFPIRLAMSHYSLNVHGYDSNRAWTDWKYVSEKNKYTDSSASATAFSTGVKIRNKVVGIDPDGKRLYHITDRFEDMGKSTGLVTSVMWSDATPASFCVHNIYRKNFIEIAREMICESRLDVLMGCGHPFYDNSGQPHIEGDFKYVGGDSLWQTIIQGKAGGDCDGDGDPDPWQLIEEKEAFVNFETGETPKRLLGIPKVYKTLQEKREDSDSLHAYTTPMNPDVPNLAEMALAALNVLDENPAGFFLMVEGGAPDWAGHDNRPGNLIEEMIDFNRSVEAVIQWIQTHSSWKKTLLVVTADHETGYLVGKHPQYLPEKSKDPKTWLNLVNNGRGHMPGMVFLTDKHTNSLVPFFAKGAGSRRFTALADDTDPMRGPYLDNAEVGRMLHQFYEDEERTINN